MTTKTTHRIAIRYCIGCRWGLRAAWMAKELLATFESELAEIALIPDAAGGVFEIHAGDRCLWSRQRDGGFPEITELKRRVRDVVAPRRSLGHSERKSSASGVSRTPPED